MRLIDKEALCGLLADKALEAQLEDECTELAIKECLSIVRRIPEAVVRCRECIWARVADNDREPKYRCVHLIRYGCKKWLYSNDFCSYGERKDGDGNG